jgi:hypothetical protein
MAACGISLNVSTLQSDITGKIGTLINLSGIIGTPPGLVAIQGAVTGAVATLKASVLNMIPDIPFAAELTSLRDQIGEYAALPDKLAAGAIDHLEGMLGDYADVVNIDGFANINLSDLANSAFGIGVSFDPCALASGIPNVVKDANGMLNKLATTQPFLGGAELPSFNASSITKLKDNFKLGGMENISFDSITDSLKIGDITDINALTSAASSLNLNVSPSITGMGNTIRKLSSGKQIMETASDYVSRVKKESLTLMAEV